MGKIKALIEKELKSSKAEFLASVGEARGKAEAEVQLLTSLLDSGQLDEARIRMNDLDNVIETLAEGLGDFAGTNLYAS